MSTHTESLETTAAPDTMVDAAGLFGIKTKMTVPLSAAPMSMCRSDPPIA
jgi:hypothetical protein